MSHKDAQISDEFSSSKNDRRNKGGSWLLEAQETLGTWSLSSKIPLRYQDCLSVLEEPQPGCDIFAQSWHSKNKTFLWSKGTSRQKTLPSCIPLSCQASCGWWMMAFYLKPLILWGKTRYFAIPSPLLCRMTFLLCHECVKVCHHLLGVCFSFRFGWHLPAWWQLSWC